MMSMRRSLALIAIAALMMVGCDKPTGSAPGPGGGPGAAPPTPEVSVLVAKAETVPITRDLVGRLAATRTAQVRARVAGIVLERVYTEGTDVQRGQVLFRIDPARLEARLRAEDRKSVV